jgi:adenylyltransferase/sulfurtransferase
MNSLSEEEKWTYSRQLVLPEIGYEGQLRLKEGHVLLAGVGGLGTPIALQLAAMGVGHLKIVDRDIVSISDLHRQYLYDHSSIGLPKVEIASLRLSALNPRINVEPIPTSIKNWNIDGLLEGIDVVVDGLDSIETRYIINRACSKLDIPYVYGGAIRAQGIVSTIIPKRTPCLECFSPMLSDEDLPKCAVVGVYTPVLGIVASIEVSESIRLLMNREPMLAGKLLFIDGQTLSFEEVTVKRFDECPICGEAGKPVPIDEKLVEEQCSRDGRRTLVITPKKWLQVDMRTAIDNLKTRGFEVEKQGRLGVTITDKKGLTVSLLKTGIAIFQVAPSEESSNIRDKAIVLYNNLFVKKE